MTRTRKIVAVVLLIACVVWLLYPRPKELELGGVGTRVDACHSSTTTTTNFSSATPSTYLTLTCDRTGEAGAANYYILASLGTTVTSVSAKPGARLVVNGSTIVEYTSGLTLSAINTGSQGVPFTFVRRVSLTNAVNTITIDVSSTPGVANVQALNAEIIAIEASSDSYYGEDVGAAYCSGASASFFSVASTTINETAASDFLFAWSWQGYHEDESAVVSLRFGHDNGSEVYQKSNSGGLDAVANNALYYSQGGVAFDTIPAATNQIYEIETLGAGSADETCTNKAAIVAIPFSDFPEYYTDTQGATFHRRTYSNTNLSITQTLQNADYIVLAGVSVANENINEAGGWQLQNIRAGVTAATHQIYHMEDRDFDAATSETFLSGYFYATTTYGSASYNFRIQGRSTANTASTEGTISDGFMFIGRIRPPGNATPEITGLVNGPSPVNVGATERWEVYWSDEDVENNTQLLCKTNSITPGAVPACPGGEWGSAAFSGTSPAVITYVALVGDIGTKNFYAFTCDDEACSVVEAGTFVVQAAPNPTAQGVLNAVSEIRNGVNVLK